MFNKWIVAIILVLAIILAQPVVAADDTNNDEEISIDYVFESGMPASTTLLKDNDGFIWLPIKMGWFVMMPMTPLFIEQETTLFLMTILLIYMKTLKVCYGLEHKVVG